MSTKKSVLYLKMLKFDCKRKILHRFQHITQNNLSVNRHGPAGFFKKQNTCPVKFSACPGRPGTVFVRPCTVHTAVAGLSMLAGSWLLLAATIVEIVGF